MKYLKEYSSWKSLLLKSNNKSDSDIFDELSDYLQELFDMFRVKEIARGNSFESTDIRWLKVDDSIKIYTNNEDEEEKIISELRKRRVNIENRLGHKLYIVPMSNYGVYGIRIQILR